MFLDVWWYHPYLAVSGGYFKAVAFLILPPFAEELKLFYAVAEVSLVGIVVDFELLVVFLEELDFVFLQLELFLHLGCFLLALLEKGA